MTYSIFNGGNLVTSFDREDEAREAVERQRLLLVAFDDAGNAIGDSAPGERLGPAA